MHFHDRSILLLPCFLLLCVAMVSCAPAYNPNALHIPLYTSKGEIHAAAYVGTNGFDAHTSYSPAENYTIAAAVSYQSNIDSFYSSKRTMGELAVGYYTSLERVGRIDLMAGVGTGHTHSSIVEERKLQAFGKGWLTEFSGSFIRYFVQGSVGLPLDHSLSSKGEPQSETGIAVRSTLVTFYRVDTSSRPPDYVDNLFFEPVFFARTGWENVKVELQAGVSFPLNRKVAYDWQMFHCAVGFHLTFGQKHKEEKPIASEDPVPPYVDAGATPREVKYQPETE